jgi:hypothetical protein
VALHWPRDVPRNVPKRPEPTKTETPQVRP